MPNVKLFRAEDQDFTLSEGDNPCAVHAFVNAGISDGMGGGYGVFGAGCHMDWTVTYDELLFIHAGRFRLKVGNDMFHAGPGDTLWIPRNTPLSYISTEDVWFFFAVNPTGKSPSASQTTVFPDAPPGASPSAGVPNMPGTGA